MYFRLHNTSVPVLGKIKSVVCDLSRKRYSLIPNALYEMLESFRSYSIKEIGKVYRNPGMVREYFHFLEREGHGFFTRTPELFPPPDFQWTRPEGIISAEVTLKGEISNPIVDGVKELNSLQGKHLEISFTKFPEFRELEHFLGEFENSGFRTFDFLLPYPENMKETIWGDLVENYKKFNFLLFYNAPTNSTSRNYHILFTKKTLEQLKTPGNPDFNQLVLNPDFFRESRCFNPYYNKKVVLNEKGEIRNYPEQEKPFGKLEREPLKQVVESPEFQELWYASNDKVLELKDWELRYCWMNHYPMKKIGKELYQLAPK